MVIPKTQDNLDNQIIVKIYNKIPINYLIKIKNQKILYLIMILHKDLNFNNNLQLKTNKKINNFPILNNFKHKIKLINLINIFKKIIDILRQQIEKQILINLIYNQVE